MKGWEMAHLYTSFVILAVLFASSLVIRFRTGGATEWYPAERRYLVPDLAKGLTILNIIFMHSVWWSGQTYIEYDFIRQGTLLLDVPVFFFVSGRLATLRKISVKKFMIRFLNLYVPYLVMIMFLVLIYWIVSGVVVLPRDFGAWLMMDILHVKGQYAQWGCVTGSLWFLQAFVLVYLASPLLLKAAESALTGIVTVIVLVAAVAKFTVMPGQLEQMLVFGLIPLQYVVFYALFFVLGALTAVYTLDFRRTAAFSTCVLLSAVLFFSFYGFSADIQSHKFPPDLLYLILSMESAVLVLFACSFEGRLKAYMTNINSLEAGHTFRKSPLAFYEPLAPSHRPLCQRGEMNTSLWQREVRRDLPSRIGFNFDALYKSVVRFTAGCGRNVYHIYLFQGFGAMLGYPLSALLAQFHWTMVLAAVFTINLFVSLALAVSFSPVSGTFLGLIGGRSSPQQV